MSARRLFIKLVLVVLVVVVPAHVALVVLVVARVAETTGARLDEAQSDAENDVEAGGELYLSENVCLL